MPRATVRKETEHFDLKSLPDGFVELKRMTYGQSVQRRALLKLTVESSKGKKDFKGEMAMASEEIQLFEFKNCIVDHNLEDEEGNKLNLTIGAGLAQLDPKIGQEIEKYIGDMNNFEDDEEGD